MTNVDEEWGEKCEELFLLTINMYNKTKNKNCVYDFKHKKNEKNIAELKSRRYNFSWCPDWQISQHKFQQFKMLYNQGYKIIVYNLFYDGLYYWRYTPDKAIKECNYRFGGRDDRGKNERKPYHYIKGEFMKKSRYNIKAPDLFDECLI